MQGRLNWSAERIQAQKDVLFWARRLSYMSADLYPEWRDKYKEAKERLKKLREQEK